jgi:hypothetical protein
MKNDECENSSEGAPGVTRFPSEKHSLPVYDLKPVRVQFKSKARSIQNLHELWCGKGEMSDVNHSVDCPFAYAPFCSINSFALTLLFISCRSIHCFSLLGPPIGLAFLAYPVDVLPREQRVRRDRKLPQ